MTENSIPAISMAKVTFNFHVNQEIKIMHSLPFPLFAVEINRNGPDWFIIDIVAVPKPLVSYHHIVPDILHTTKLALTLFIKSLPSKALEGQGPQTTYIQPVIDNVEVWNYTYQCWSSFDFLTVDRLQGVLIFDEEGIKAVLNLKVALC